MPAGTGCHCNQPVGALFDGFPCEAVIDDVVQRDAAMGTHRFVDFLARAERRDHDRHFLFDADVEVTLESFVRTMHDQVGRERRCRALGVCLVVPVTPFLDARNPPIELDGFTFLFARVKRRKTTDNPGRALGNDKIGIGDDEHRRTDHRDTQVLQYGW